MAASNDRPVEAHARVSAWAPLQRPAFRALWLVSALSSVGLWMHDVGSAWLMTTLAPSPLMVALVQVTANLPMVLLALPAGALADLVDRRRLLLVTQSWQCVATAGLGLLVLGHMVSPWGLLVFTFVLRAGMALGVPVRQSLVSELVPHAELQAAIGLSSAAVNVARALGPALAGLVMALLGYAAPFLCNAGFLFAGMRLLYRWQPEARPRHTLPAEHFLEAIRAGVRYTRNAPALQAVFIRASTCMIGGSAFWALLPILVRTEFHLGAVGYGLLLSSFGLGAVVGTLLMPSLQQHIRAEHIVAGATSIFALVLLLLPQMTDTLGFGGCLFLAGIMWLWLLSSFNTSAQVAAPAWVRGRALAVYSLVFAASLALGSALWGAIATLIGIPETMMLAGVSLLGFLGMTLRYPLVTGERYEGVSSIHWPAPLLTRTPAFEQGPVLVTVEYRIDPLQCHEFLHAMHELSAERRRNGAIHWDIYNDMADTSRYLETFLLQSWGDHLREAERLTVVDWEVQEQAYAFHRAAGLPKISYLLAERPMLPT